MLPSARFGPSRDPSSCPLRKLFSPSGPPSSCPFGQVFGPSPTLSSCPLGQMFGPSQTPPPAFRTTVWSQSSPSSCPIGQLCLCRVEYGEGDPMLHPA